MNAPDKIYVLPEWASVVKVLDEEVEYIRKDALLEWAKTNLSCPIASLYDEGVNAGLQMVIDKLNSM